MVALLSGQDSANVPFHAEAERKHENENAPTPNLNTEVSPAQDLPKIRRNVTHNTAPLMEVTQRSVNGTNVQNHVVGALKSEPEPAPTPHPNTVENLVWFLALPSNEENAKPSLVLDTLNSDPGPHAPNLAQVVSKSKQENVTLLAGQVLSTARILDPHTKPESARPNPAPSTVCGELGHPGPNAPNPVVKDRRPRAECATTPHHNMEGTSAQDTTPSKLCVRSNPAPFMEVGLSGPSMELAVRAVVAANKCEHANAPTPHPNTVARHAQV